MAGELALARSGALDTDLLSQQPFYGTNFTKPLLFIEDGAYFSNKATALGLTGEQWGVMNETGSYPGQPWLWLYTLWYQVPGWTNSDNIDMIAVYMTGAATILLLCVPFIPGLRDIPRLIPVHKLIWRNWDGTPPESGAVWFRPRCLPAWPPGRRTGSQGGRRTGRRPPSRLRPAAPPGPWPRWERTVRDRPAGRRRAASTAGNPLCTRRGTRLAQVIGRSDEPFPDRLFPVGHGHA